MDGSILNFQNTRIRRFSIGLVSNFYETFFSQKYIFFIVFLLQNENTNVTGLSFSFSNLRDLNICKICINYFFNKSSDVPFSMDEGDYMASVVFFHCFQIITKYFSDVNNRISFF